MAPLTAEEKRPASATIAVSVGLTVVMWSLNFIAAKIGLRQLGPLTMAAFRVVLAGAVMVPAYLVCRRLPSFAPHVMRPPSGFSIRDLWVFTYLGFFGVCINQVCFTVGLRYTSVGHSAVIIGMGPIYVLALASAMRLERLTLRKVVGMGVSLIGVIVLATEEGIGTHSPTFVGDAITMAGSIGFALYAVLGKRVAANYDTLTMTAFNQIVGAIIALPVAVLEAMRLGAVSHWAAIGWPAWAATGYMAAFGSAGAYLLYFWLLRYMPPSQLSAFSYLLPVTATLLGIWWLGEKGSWNQLAGGALVLAGVYWIESGRNLEPGAEDARG
ncbi:MAG TPA: EamA family transporter [Candidatus Acidoferrales bacterium]|nr:EamA family transporter [Candidatus Acidoferrales bacterium]